MDRKQKWSLWALSSVPLVMTLGNSMLIPVLPLIEKKLKITDFQVSLIITIYSIVAILLIPVAGYLSDKWGRKKVIIPSLLIAGIGGAFTGWVSWKFETPFMWILIGRVIQGVGSAGAMPVVIPCVGDMFEDEKQVSTGLGLVETSNTLGKVLSPILGSLLASFVWFLPFWFIPVLCIISIILIIFFVKPPKQKQEAPPLKIFLQNVKSILCEKGRWLFPIFLLGGIVMFILFGVLFYLSSILEKKYHLDGVWKGVVLAIPLASLSLTSYLTGKKIGNNKTIMKWCICIGFFLLGITLIIPIFFKNIYIIIVCLVFSGLGIGVSLPSLDALITEGIQKEQRGSITSLYSSMRFVGVAAGPPVFALLMKGPDNYIFLLSIFLAIGGAILAFFFIKPKTDEKSGVENKEA
ncbi:MFS transporter [Bacillus sp. RG28]|uniref:MFS transporter n=1 Tax=Gottfriedia endophytica TaxID=2820819 RepID=A0A940NP37_9BACI|nr:MFS transporter [Gottfriedia endophytica]MBP0725729.1 MFS transporter [Gottfriedia endophytica]